MLPFALKCIFIWCCIPVQVLAITTLPDQETIFHHRIVPGDIFKTVYIHSLELTPVWEYFTIDENYDILLTDTLYESTGAGLPIPLYGRDKFRKEGPQFHIFEINRHLPSIYLRINANYGNCFFFNDVIGLNLSEIVGNGVTKIETTRETLGIFLWNELRETRETLWLIISSISVANTA